MEAIQTDAENDQGDEAFALAAAEVVAALGGKPADDLPEEVTDWVRKNPGALSPELVAKALATVEHIRKYSELKELWVESGNLEDWDEEMGKLLDRLRAT